MVVFYRILRPLLHNYWIREESECESKGSYRHSLNWILILNKSFYKARRMETYVSDIFNVAFQIPVLQQWLFHFQTRLYTACPSLGIYTDTHMRNNSRGASRRDPWNLWCFMIVLKYTISPHFCLSLAHRGLLYGIESQIRHVPGCLTRRCAFHCLPREPFSRYSFLLDIPIYGKGDPRAQYSLCLWKDSKSAAVLTSQWSKHLHNCKLGVLLSSSRQSMTVFQGTGS